MGGFYKIGLVFIFLIMSQCSFAQMWTSENLTTYKTYDEMAHIFDFEDETTYVINFWATWCVNKNKIESEVIYLEDGKYNDWIDKVDPAWSGAIPITVIYNQEGRIFLEREFHSTEEIVEQIP